MNLSAVTQPVGYVVYALLALCALWGAFSVVILWRRLARARFRSERVQAEFLDHVDQALARRDFNAAAQLCERDPRALSQLILLATVNRQIGYAKVRQLVLDRFQRDVLAEFEHRLAWVNTMVKSAPMLGLLGTVVGMIGAFAELAAPKATQPVAGATATDTAGGEQKDVSVKLAENISLALDTTAYGLFIAIPLIMAMSSISIRIRRFEDGVALGLTRFLDSFKASVAPS